MVSDLKFPHRQNKMSKNIVTGKPISSAPLPFLLHLAELFCHIYHDVFGIYVRSFCYIYWDMFSIFNGLFSAILSGFVITSQCFDMFIGMVLMQLI